MFVDSWSCIFTCRLPFLLSNQQCHSIELCDRIHCLWVCLNTDGQPVLFTIWAKKRKNYDAWLFSVITSRRSRFTCDRHKGTIRNLFYITRKLNTKNRWTWENLKAVVESVKGRLVGKGREQNCTGYLLALWSPDLSESAFKRALKTHLFSTAWHHWDIFITLAPDINIQTYLLTYCY